MGMRLARRIKGMRWWGKTCGIVLLLMGIFIYQGMFRPQLLDSATNTYYFTLDSTAVNLGVDGSTNTSTRLNAKISMKTGVYSTARSVTAASSTAEQTMIRAYGPVYATKQTLTAPALTIGVRDRNGTANAIYWKAYVYAYNPAGTLNNGTLLWTSDEKEAHPSVQTPLEMTFTNPQPKEINAGLRVKVVITARMASTASSARFYWGGGTNYSFFTVTEAAYVADSVTVTNLADYYNGQLATVTQGDRNVVMLKYDIYSNVSGGATWTGGKLDKIGTNTSVYLNSDEPGDVTFSIYKDGDNDGVFETADILVGGPYNFAQLTGQTYVLTTPQAITTTPQRYFVTYNISRTAIPSTTVGARIVDNGYFTVAGAAGGVQNVASTSSSTPNILYGGTAVTKIYAADWDTGTSLTGISESGGPSGTDSVCLTRSVTVSPTYLPLPLVGVLNYPAHTCASVAGAGYTNNTGTTQADFARLYFSGPGYASAMKTIKGGSFTYRVYTPSGGGTVTLRLFYVTSGGVRVNAPISSTWRTTSSVSQAITTSLAGQDFTNIPAGSRLGIQIGVTSNVRIGLGRANGTTGSTTGANLTVQETAAENENVDVGNGVTVPNISVYASDTGKVLNSFTLVAAKAKTVTGITVTGSPLFNSTNVKNVRLYADTGTFGVVDGETALATLPGSSISNNSIGFTGLSLAVSTSVKRYLVTVDIADTPNVNIIMNALVTGLTIDNPTALNPPPAMGNNTDSASATITILPTTSLTDGDAEPPPGIIKAGAAPTRIDAFGIKTNGGLNDQITTVTVTLNTTSPLPEGFLISDFVAKIEVVNNTNTVVYGTLTSPTIGDQWQVATSGLFATPGTTECYVRISPKTNLGETFVTTAAVTSLTHIRTANKLVLQDGGVTLDETSAAITLDGAPPTNPGNFTATTGTAGRDISLNWDEATDTSGGTPITYTLVRGLGNAPPPRDCNPVPGKVFLVYQGSYPGTNPDYYNTELEEGQSYSYRICSTDTVGNRSPGATATATAGIMNRCNLAPNITINPSATYVNAGQTVQLTVAVTNRDTGVCGSASTFHLSTVGTPNTTDFNAPVFTENDFVLPTNNGSKYIKLNITAKPGASQLAMNHFEVKVDKSGASAATTQYNDPVHVIVNRYGGMMHSSMQLGTNKFGQWGLDYSCSTCHSPTATNLKRVSNSITTPTGDRPVVFNTVSAASTVTTGVMGNDLGSGTSSTNVCAVCHHNARFHQYSSSKVEWKTHNNSTDCMRCHDHRIGFKTLADGLSCDDCHGNPPTKNAQLVVPPTNVLFPYVTGDDAGAHDLHDNRKISCKACHSNANHPVSAQPDMKLNMGFSIWSGNFPGFNGAINTGTVTSVTPANEYVYEAATGTTIAPSFDKRLTCSVYCHGYWNGSYTVSGGFNTEPSWNGVTQTGCAACHAATNSDPPDTGSHSKHASNIQGYGNNIACSVCHGFRNYTTSAEHLNGNVEWDLSAYPNATYNGTARGGTGALAPTNSASYKTCSTLYCHSNVQSAGGTDGPTFHATPTWGDTVDCGSCHTHPDTGDHTSGGHSQHTAEGVTGFDCRICHAGGGSTNSLNHANSRIDFTFAGLGANTHYSYSGSKAPGSAGYGTCYNGNCHGRSTVTWGPSSTTPLCEKCHSTGVTAAGFYGTTGPSGTKAVTDPYVGAHFQHITSMPFRFSAKLDCTECHVKPSGPYSPGHIDTSLPAEVLFGSLATSGAQNGYSSAANQPAYNYATRECSNVWCHGAGMNSNEGTGPYGSVGPTGDGLDGGTLGDPVAAVWNLPYLAAAPDQCQACHATPPAAPKSGYEHFNDDTGAPYSRNLCTNCHRHLNAAGDGFSNPLLHVNGSIDSCNTCHGRPPVDERGLTVPAIGALSTGMVGAHQAHRLNPAIGNDCDACHYNYTYDMPSYKLEIGFRAYGGRVTRGVFYGMTSLSEKSTAYAPRIAYFSTWTSTRIVPAAETNAKFKTCANLYCHGGGTNTLPALAGGSNTTPNWEAGSSQVTCGTCHGVTGDTYTATGSHLAHVGLGYGKPRIGCANCHGIKENNYHVDGAVEWEFYSSAQRLNQLPGYSGTGYKPAGGSSFATSGLVQNLAPSVSWGTCQVYCHSDGKGAYANPAPVWGGPAMHCGSCHLNQTSSFSGSHEKHSKSGALGGYGIDCLICHYGSGSGSALHVNGSFEVVFNTDVVGPSAAWDNDSKQCFSILCHDSTATTGPTWNVAGSGNYDTGTYKPTCIGCHSGEVNGRTAVIPQFAGQSHHYQGLPISNDICYPCHMESNANGTANTLYHDRTANKTVDLMIWGAGARGSVFTRYTANGNTTRQRTEFLKLNSHCLGCHNEANKASNPLGDGKSPIQYAWDGKSIDARYNQAGTTAWGKVNSTTYANANERDKRTKAYSAHGNVGANQRGWNTTTGFDGPFPADVVNTGKNVVCFDCHNSHGTTASGIMTSYSSATGRGKGGILKETNSGVGGYSVTYQPVAGGSAETKNIYNPGAAICIDCHTTANAESKPWSYDSTFGLTQQIYGYWDTPGFGGGTFGPAQRSSYRESSGPNKGGHFGASSDLTTTTRKPAIPNAGVTMSAGINGLCTPCHDPHGVSPVTPANQQYMVPLLKGTWVTSPYDEDIAAAGINQARGGSNKNSSDGVTGGTTLRPIRQLVGSTPLYKIDQNTFSGTTNTSQPNFGSVQTAPSWDYTTATKIGNTESQFAGLCMSCHVKASLAPKAGQAVAPDAWKSVSRIHGTVKGWATTVQASDGNYNNTIHSFTCSKCHTPHNAKLPRLMVTNCLDYNHRGQVASGGTVSATAGNSSGGGGGTNITASGHQIVTGEKGKGQGRFPSGGRRVFTDGSKQQNPGKWFFGANGVGSTNFINCHNSGLSGGTSYPNSMLWNTKTPW